jgi:DNA polymerase-3 subunit gamma/tau
VVRLVDRLAARDARGLLNTVAAIDEFAPDYGQLLDEIAALLQKVAVRQAVPDLTEDEMYDRELLTALAERLPADDLQLCFQLAIVGRRDLELAPDPRIGLEMTLLRMLAFRPADAADRGGPDTEPRREPKASSPAPDAAPRTRAGDDNWPEMLARLDLQGAVRQLAGHCQLLGREGNRFRFLLDARAQSLHTRQQEERLAQALGRLVGTPVVVEIEQGGVDDTPARREQQARDQRLEQARAALESDPKVKALRDRFGAVLQPESVKPVG